MQTVDFAIEGFSYDAKLKRYRWTDGAGKGAFASKSAILNYSKSAIVTRSNELIQLGAQLSEGKINLAQFQQQAAEKLKQIHLLNAVNGANGSENLFANDYLRIGRELASQYYKGKGEDGKPFGIKHLAADVQAGKVSPAILASRLKAYAQSGKRTYWQTVQAKNEGKLAQRVLKSGHVHCQSCIALAAEPAKPIDEVILPCHLCECLSNCLCSIRFI